MPPHGLSWLHQAAAQQAAADGAVSRDQECAADPWRALAREQVLAAEPGHVTTLSNYGGLLHTAPALPRPPLALPCHPSPLHLNSPALGPVQPGTWLHGRRAARGPSPRCHGGLPPSLLSLPLHLPPTDCTAGWGTCSARGRGRTRCSGGRVVTGGSGRGQVGGGGARYRPRQRPRQPKAGTALGSK